MMRNIEAMDYKYNTVEDTDIGMEPISSSNKSLTTSGSNGTTSERAGKSEIEDDDDIDNEDLDETLSERLWGLREMFPEEVRNTTHTVMSATCTGVKGFYGISRVVAWFLFSSSVILFAPLILEMRCVQIEEIQRSQQKQVLLGPSSAMSGSMGLMPSIQR